MDIQPDEVYTTEEARDFLKVSESTIKRMLKNGIIRANKVGGRYRILGKEILHVISPKAEAGAIKVYQKFKKNVKEKIKDW